VVRQFRKETGFVQVTTSSPVGVRTFVPHFSVSQLRSKKAPDFGAGNWTAFRAVARQLAAAGVKQMCVQPIHETPPGMASYFSRSSMNALSHRLLVLTDIPEIRNSPRLARQVRKQLANYAAHSIVKEGTDLRSVEAEHPPILAKAFEEFRLLPQAAVRNKQFTAFCLKQSWWLLKYAYFMALREHYSGFPMERWDEELAEMNSPKARDFMALKSARIMYFKYVQMECYRQAKEALAYAKSLGIEEIEGQVGVGIARESAEAFLMRDIFDFTRQIGCFPEPENGYPVQLWGFLAERNNQALLDFKVKSNKNFHALGFDRLSIDHAAGFLGGYTTFPVYDPAELARGNFRLLDPGMPADAAVAERGGEWAIPLQQEERRQTYAKKVLFALLEMIPGMKFSAETVGDWLRRIAAEGAINAAIAQGYDITLMRALPWETEALGNYRPVDRLSLTHDMPALTGLLTGQAGEHKYGWIDGPRVGMLLNRFGVLAPGLGRPLTVSELTTEFMMEIHRRIVAGTTAGTVSLPLASLFTLLPAYLDNGKWQYTNIQPGTQGEVGNLTGNWEQRLPNIEELAPANRLIRDLAARENRPFGQVISLTPQTFDCGFQAQGKMVYSESVVYQAASGNWTVWQPGPGQKAVMELAVNYDGPKRAAEKAFARFNLFPFLGKDLQLGKLFNFLDLVSGLTTVPDLAEGFLVGLPAGTKEKPGLNRHHFVVLAEG
jgi:hypothetical protein